MTLRELVSGPDVVVVPGVYDVITARLAESEGFSAAYLTGAGVSLSVSGIPDLGVVSFSEVLDRLTQVTAAVEVPLIADADTGFGGILSVVRTVREFERHGAAAIQLEDQVFPKRCGHEPGTRCVPPDDMVASIGAALDTRRSADFLLLARTDARTSEGLDAAVDRAGRYAEAGADLVFVEALRSAEEIATVAEAVDVPLVVNFVEGGQTPLLPLPDLARTGCSVALFPNTLLRALVASGRRVLSTLRTTGTTVDALPDLADHDEVWRLFRRDEWLALERRHAPMTPADRPREG